MPLDSGTRLGTYEILGPLGSGGMGEVYRASDTRLGREVAIKILPEAFAQDPARLARFEREARALASLNHPGLAAIYGLEEAGPVRYIVMELVPGETLAEKMAVGPVPIRESLQLSAQIADALETAHQKGIVHRDLKPSNIKVTPEGKVKVLDLGLAKVMDTRAEPEDISKSPTVVVDQTRPGVILGTAEFMSPEQARGKEVDKRSDIWSFGCILFEMLSGRRAFTGETVSDVLAAILAAEPDWAALPAETPARIRELLSRCLQKDVSRRLRDIGDARMEIDQCLAEREGESPPAERAVRPAPRWHLAAVAAVASVLAAAAIWYLLRPSSESARVPNKKYLAVLPFRDLSGRPGGQLVGDGLVETVSVRLAKVPGVQVVTPSASVGISDKESDPYRIARNLGANLLLRGAVQREGDQVRITYSVLNVRDGVQVLGDDVTGPASDLFGMQDRLAESVAAALKLPRGARQNPTASGLETASEQERYLQAIGLLQRYDRRDAVERALEILRGLAEERPNSALVEAALSRASLAMFQFTKDRSWAERALATADAARALDPTLSEVDVALGETLLTTGRAKEAVDAFRRALAASPDDFQALLGLGRASEKAGNDVAAEAAFRRAIELQPSAFAGYNHLGGLFASRGRYREAAGMFRRATFLTPDNYRAWSNLGGAWTNACDFASALEGYQKALSLRPRSPVALSNLGLTQLWTGRYAEAVESLELASQYGPKDYRIWGNLGDAYRGVRGRSDEAAKAYARSLELARVQLRLNPQDAAAHSFVATGLAKTGHSSEAGEEMRRALAIDPKEPNILSDAAIVAAVAGRTEEAIEWLRKAVEAGYCRVIIARRPEFEVLRGDPRFQDLVRSAARGAA